MRKGLRKGGKGCEHQLMRVFLRFSRSTVDSTVDITLRSNEKRGEEEEEEEEEDDGEEEEEEERR